MKCKQQMDDCRFIRKGECDALSNTEFHFKLCPFYKPRTVIVKKEEKPLSATQAGRAKK